jgi:hypothetical protein
MGDSVTNGLSRTTEWLFERRIGIVSRRLVCRPYAHRRYTIIREFIAEGNPDEEKIGAFGVGFYSLFSVTDDPLVKSGGTQICFPPSRSVINSLHSRMDGLLLEGQ